MIHNISIEFSLGRCQGMGPYTGKNKVETCLVQLQCAEMEKVFLNAEARSPGESPFIR